MAKTLYHSNLTREGQVLVKITSDVIPSKFKGQAPFVAMVINGEERNYSVENEACAAVLRGRKGQMLLIQADGRGESATINLFAAPAGATMQAPAPAQQQPPPPPPAQQQQAPPPAQYQQPAPAPAPRQQAPPAQHQPAAAPLDAVGQVLALAVFLRRNGNAVQLAAKAVLDAAGKFAESEGVPLTPDIRRGMAQNLAEDLCKGSQVTTLLIRAERAGLLETFPGGELKPLVDKARERVMANRAPAPAPVAPPPPPPPPAPEPDPYDAPPDAPPSDDDVPL